ncbi:3-oxoacyl-[acyl-carrier protein] reductase [Burkholderia sp. YR290]|jgi:3-oxoacyl-[acyl-carrier protein] reductase|uniref:SDR family NAD(P)-dependent oxidoreductase n=1 Tax=Paraburkholderia hospita TaxID=169430 RepID=UPI000271CFCE|nr:SDR family NAD(P)-dependent oxidoreductase [Paraburkholderia hospita]EUC17154.1 3-oxoacyl-(acyl-carrier-protein) reductase [Burkholderia sp. BT03]SKC70004.1 3-oxoacyl-[acyl-carrier protein] reductase [Burkholderia sp. CF099]SOE56381.1 3-oxoacyl-[acyl-carrier protein] reductase [Burkholderia sp. YR290]SKC78973.1 3-oxoacyl-[acyl-carrier protein] reductase [Paraburkholderia hospita]SKC96812.1 3-oxoacyl-[acyl-carrier protein] reductase [Paraburkholderia hospita]
MGKLDGKVALVTGSGRGIGRAIVEKFASEGARIVVNDLDADPAHETVEALKKMGVEAAACVGNVTAPDFADRFVGTALKEFKGIDIIVNNAGYTWDDVIQKMSDEQWYAIIDCHMTAPFRILRAAYPHVKALHAADKEAGREVYRKIVNISSVSALNGNAGQMNYSSAKAGVIGMTRALAREWGRFNVNVNCVAFGLIHTRMTSADAHAGATVSIDGRDIRVGLNPDMLKSHAQRNPLGRGGTPEEAAGGVYLFCSPESNYITGQTIAVAGNLQ